MSMISREQNLASEDIEQKLEKLSASMEEEDFKLKLGEMQKALANVEQSLKNHPWFEQHGVHRIKE